MGLFKSKWFSLLLLAVIGWLGLSFIRINLQEDIVNKEVEDIQNKAASLEKSNSYLERILAYMKKPSFLEKEARLQLNYKAPGETVVFVYPDESAKQASRSAEQEDLNSLPNYLKWWHYLIYGSSK